MATSSSWLLVLLAMSVPALAQQQSFREVTEGVFQLPTGSSMDLTQHKILLTMRGQPSVQDQGSSTCVEPPHYWKSIQVDNDRMAPAGAFFIFIDGVLVCASAGNRLDLKKLPSSGALLDEKKVCLLDVAGFALPQGESGRRSGHQGGGTATFRLNCR